MAAPTQCRCGLIINPIAGMGGRVGLKGTDGPIVLAEARRRGAEPLSESRAIRALERLKRAFADCAIVTGSGSLGEDAARRASLDVEVVLDTVSRPGNMTTAADTVRLARALERAGVPLILVAGGDGTVRDVFGSIADRVPLLGIPAGVKMHSALFATSPALAGDVGGQFLAGSPAVVLRNAEIMDVDEAAVRDDRISARLFGYGRTPFERTAIQGPKAGGAFTDDDALWAAAREVVAGMQPGAVYLLGPGSTVRMVADLVGIKSTLLGVDAIRDGEMIGSDLSEQQILEVIADRPAWIIAGVVGGQGCLFGRGNQQFSAAVLRQIGRANVIVLAGMEKLTRLAPSRLFVDTGDLALDALLAGYVAVNVGPGRRAMMRVDA